MEESENQESARPKAFIIEAPQYLESEQNIYDQEPFLRVIHILSGKTGIEVERLRELLTSVFWNARDVLVGTDYDSKYKGSDVFNPAALDIKRLTSDQVKALASASIRSLYGHQKTKSKAPRLGPLIEPMIGVLNKYPYWLSYLDVYSRDFDTKGGISGKQKHSQIPVEVPSYGYWANEKQRREGVLTTKGIEDIFPQDVKGTAIGDVVGGTGERRRWVILAASDLTSKTS